MNIKNKLRSTLFPRRARSVSIVHLTPGDFAGADLKNFEPADLPAGALKTPETGAATAVLVSAPIRTAFPCDQVLAGANAGLGPKDRLEAAVQVNDGAGWSPWFEFGVFSPDGEKHSVKDQQNAFGRMNVDILTLSKKAVYLRYRVTIHTVEGSRAILKLAYITYTDTTAPYEEKFAVKRSPDLKAVKLAVPEYSQIIQKTGHSRDICSPTSLAMALSYLGIKTNVLKTAREVLDTSENIYGNWNLNVMHAGTKGVYAWLARFNSLDEAHRYLAAGIPIVASLTFGPGELKRSPLEKTRGHFIVIKGFDSRGNILANDPAAPDETTVERVYDRKEFAGAWLKNKYGLAYMVIPLERLPITAGIPLADLFSVPLNLEKDDKARFIETQVLPLENLSFISSRGGWIKVKALEQPHEREGKSFGRYSGWIESRCAALRPMPEPDAVVAVKKAAIKDSSSSELSMGTRVKVIALEKTGARIILPGGGTALVNDKDLNFLPVKLTRSDLRERILATARRFMGDRYCWGGRSGYGVDCSGLVNLVYRVWGVDLPRNASDQLHFGRAVSRKSLKPADLIFSTEKNNAGNINHVMLYAGDGTLIEATQDSGTVREIGLKKKFGLDTARIDNGLIINGRKIYYRTVLG